LEFRGASGSAKPFKIAFYVNSFKFIGFYSNLLDLIGFGKFPILEMIPKNQKNRQKKVCPTRTFMRPRSWRKMQFFLIFFGTTPSRKGAIPNKGGMILINWGLQNSSRGVMGKGVVFWTILAHPWNILKK
jgi:hypothetical protein